jgi:hypothetical protein
MALLKSPSGSKVTQYLARQAYQNKHRPRLIFALDATASRQPTWDRACVLQAEIFSSATAAAAGVEVQLVYFRGLGECRASRWYSNSADLNASMTKITCQSGMTQIGKVLKHARDEASNGNVKALVFIGDTFEEEINDMIDTATGLGVKGVSIFMLQEGSDREAERAYKMLAHASGGVHLRFDASAPAQMQKLLQAVGTYLTTGKMDDIKALAHGGTAARIGK